VSNALAIAAVTYVLRNHLAHAWSAASAMTGSVDFTAMPPSRVKTGDMEKPQINLFLYHVAPNPGWRNVGLPSRSARGERETNPPLALDLHFLLSAYGTGDLEAEILLGHAMQALHETPVLGREGIRDALLAVPVGAGTTGGTNPASTPAEKALVKSDLAEQIEQIRITPQPLNTEEISKLWSAFHAPYRPSTAYQVSVVLIERTDAVRSPLPVLTIGPVVRGRERGVTVVAGPLPILVEAVPPNRQPAVRLGDDLTLRGHRLGGVSPGDEMSVRFTHARTQRTVDVPASATTATDMTVRIPPDPDHWQAGLYTVAAVLRRAGQERTSNELPLAVAPLLVTPLATPTRTGDVVTFAVRVTPNVWEGQRVSLLVGDREIPGEPVTVATTSGLTFTAPRADLPGGSQFLRVRVDGIESLLLFDDSSRVTVP
jgi:hypothetical protein